MLRTTLVNCDLDEGLVSAELGKRLLGDLAPHSLASLLERFMAIDAVLNAIVDPEVVVETTRKKYIIRTGQGRLFLYDSRDALEPALVLTPEEVVAEVDGSAARARTRAPLAKPVEIKEEPAAAPPGPVGVSVLRPQHRLALASAALCLAAYVASPQVSAESWLPLADFTPAASTQQAEALRAELAGVYLTGSTSGHHGIAVGTDGTLKLFQINSPGTPSYLRDTYRVGHIGGQVCLVGSAPNRIIRQTARGVLAYGGETYQRLP